MRAREPRSLHRRQKIQLSEKLRDLIMLLLSVILGVTSPNITCPVKLFLITDYTCEITNMSFK